MWQMFKMTWMFQLTIDLRTMANHRWQKKADDNWKVWTSSCTDLIWLPNLPHCTSNLATKWACQVGSNALQWSLKLKMLMHKKQHPRSINKCNSSHWQNCFQVALNCPALSFADWQNEWSCKPQLAYVIQQGSNNVKLFFHQCQVVSFSSMSFNEFHPPAATLSIKA